MSIDGYIEKVSRDERTGAILLELTGREHRYTVEDPETGREEMASHYAPAGQSTLRIVQPTWTPEVGMVIWGNASAVIIEAEPKREYTRWGYVKLIEKGREEEARKLGYPSADVHPVG